MANAYGSIEIEWPDETRKYHLRWGELRELQDKTGRGPWEIFERFATRRFFVDEVREVVRLGLVGGGCAPGTAIQMVRRYVEERPIAESVPMAQAILGAAIMGVPEEDLEEVQDGGGKATATNGSGSPPSSDSELLSGGAHASSIN